MSLANQVQALELECDTLRTRVAAQDVALEQMNSRRDVAKDYWQARAERAESRVALFEAYAKAEAYAKEPPRDPGEWYVGFKIEGSEQAGLNFKSGNLAQMLSGLLTSFFDRPQAMQITIEEPRTDLSRPNEAVASSEIQGNDDA